YGHLPFLHLHSFPTRRSSDLRHSVLEDYGRMEGYTFYPDTADLEPFPSTAKRLEAFRTHALTLSLASVRDMLKDSPQFRIEDVRSEEHTSELQSRENLVCRLL